MTVLKNFLLDSSQKNKTLKNAYTLIHELGPISKNELISKMNLKPSKLSRIIEELIDRKLIYEYGVGESYGGRPPILYHVKYQSNFLIGISITRMRTVVVLMNLHCNSIAVDSFIMTSIHSPEFTLIKIRNIIDRMMELHHCSVNNILGIGVATNGIINKDKGEIVKLTIESSGQFDWVSVPIVNLLKEIYPVEILLKCNSNCAILTESRLAHSYEENILYTNFGGWKLSCCAMLNKKILFDDNDDSSNYSHMVIDVNGRDCNCGGKGCLISYSSPYYILKQLAMQVPGIGLSIKNLEEIHVDDIMEIFMQSYEETKHIVLESAIYLGIGIANMVNLYHSNLVILNGPLIQKYPNYYQKVIESALTYIRQKENVRFSRGMQNMEVAAIGAGIHVLNFFSLHRDLDRSEHFVLQ